MTLNDSCASEGERRRSLQSIGLLVCSFLAMTVAICFGMRGLVGGDTRVIHPHEKINPNTAPVGSLIRLPGIGLTRARAIAAYRDVVRQQTDGMAFAGPEDLEQIKGIGPKTAQDIAEWLEFGSFAVDGSVYPAGDPPSR